MGREVKFSLQFKPVVYIGVHHYLLGSTQIPTEIQISQVWLTGSRSTVLYPEHGFSIMTLLIQGTDGLFLLLAEGQ